MIEKKSIKNKTTERLKRLDFYHELKEKILPLCRLKYGEIWEDPIKGHRVGVLDATKIEDVKKITTPLKAKLVINDPPYNVAVGNANTPNLFKMNLDEYLEFSQKWVSNANAVLDKNSHFYVWLGADYKDNFQPFADFIIMMRKMNEFQPRNFITMRN
ncbi:MAG: site-specific DNA-methyltransferase, partial [FCB group bacterium]|nr:site-specific DNA-methyltransferase [FCB group bacterium]